MNTLTLTQSQGLEIQAKQIQRWARVLRPEVVTMITNKASIENLKLTSNSNGWDVWRGVDIDNFIHTLCYESE